MNRQLLVLVLESLEEAPQEVAKVRKQVDQRTDEQNVAERLEHQECRILEEIKNIILGGGQNFLSPERRFDAIIFSNPEIFDARLKEI